MSPRYAYTVCSPESHPHSLTLQFLEAQDIFYTVQANSMALSIQQASVWCTHYVYDCCNIRFTICTQSLALTDPNHNSRDWKLSQLLLYDFTLAVNVQNISRRRAGVYTVSVCIYVYVLSRQTHAFWICSTELNTSTVDTRIPIIASLRWTASKGSTSEKQDQGSTAITKTGLDTEARFLSLPSSTDILANSVIQAPTKEAKSAISFSTVCLMRGPSDTAWDLGNTVVHVS